MLSMNSSPPPFLPITSRTLCLDGALGTYLMQRGENLDPLLWSAGNLVSNQTSIRNVHREYLEAGADIITTASYQVSYEGFAQAAGLDRSATNAKIADSCTLVRQAIREHLLSQPSHSGCSPSLAANSTRKFTAASIGTYGAHLADGSEYRGDYYISSQELKEWHWRKYQHILTLHSELVAFETIPCLSEVSAIIGCLQDAKEELPRLTPSWITIACNSSHTLNSGEKVEDFCRLIEDPSSGSSPLSSEELLVGVNCTSPEHTEGVVQHLLDSLHTSRRLVVYPNRGDPWDDVKQAYVTTPDLDKALDDRFLQCAQCCHDLCGERLAIFGGCCRTHPELIRRLHTLINHGWSSAV